MATQQYTVVPHSIETLMTWIKTGEIAIPEIQRPFVWNATKVRNLLDSLYKGFPVGYLIAWRNPSVKLKDGSSSSGKRILIDGQQRVTALMAALIGQEVITKDYNRVRIKIAFHPQDERFEVLNSAIQKDHSWIADISEIFSPDSNIVEVVETYCEMNPDVDKKQISKVFQNLSKIVYNHVGIIELSSDLSIETITEIFIRVNSAGTELSQADFAMSKIASNETYGGNALRKAIEYFCHMAIEPDFYYKIRDNDKEFASNGYFQQMSWLKNEIDDIYDPSYTDMLRVAFTSEFKRGRLEDLVALLSGRNFETKQYEEKVAEESFERLKKGVQQFINETNFKRFIMIIRSAGFIDPSLIGSQNSLNFAYIIYLTLKSQGKSQVEIEKAVRRWFVMSMLTGRYSGSPESTFDYDIRQIHEQGFEKYANAIIESELANAFWDSLLPQEMMTSAASSPYFRVFQAAQVKMMDKGFLSRDITVGDLLLNKCDVHHIYPKNYLKKQGLSKGQYNQIANYVLAQSEINIAIGDNEPFVYFAELQDQCNGGKLRYGGISCITELKENMYAHCIPEIVFEAVSENYDRFLQERRNMMAQKIKKYFNML